MHKGVSSTASFTCLLHHPVWSLAAVTLAASRLSVAAVCPLLSSVVQQEEKEGLSGKRFFFLVTFLIWDGNLPHRLCLYLLARNISEDPPIA